eukprot:jgi/Chlat1/6090/Chrsp40S05670
MPHGFGKAEGAATSSSSSSGREGRRPQQLSQPGALHSCAAVQIDLPCDYRADPWVGAMLLAGCQQATGGGVLCLNHAGSLRGATAGAGGGPCTPSSGSQHIQPHGSDQQRGGEASNASKTLYFFLNNDSISFFSAPQHQIRRFLQAALEERDMARIIDSLGDPNKRLRHVADICRRHAHFSVDAGCSKDRISFQRVVVLLLRLVTAPGFCNNPSSTHVNNVLATMHDVEGFESALLKCVALLTERKSLRDARYLAHDRERDGNPWEPRAWTDMLLPLAAYFQEVACRFPVRTLHEPHTQRNIEELARCLQSWQQEHIDIPQGSPLAGAVVDVVGRLLRQLKEAKLREEHLTMQLERKRRRELSEQLFPPLQQIGTGDDEDILVDGPGELSKSGASRHDNDFVDFRRMSVIPTQAELLSTDSPYLPSNDTLPSSHHLPAGTSERLLDTQFRLLRADLVTPMRVAAACFREHRGSLQGNHFRVNAKSPSPQLAGAVHIANDVSVFVLRNAQLGATLEKNKRRGLCFRVFFDHPSHIERKKVAEREMYWERTRHLGLDSLVCLWARTHDNEDILAFGTVVTRDIKELVHTPLPSICVSCVGAPSSTLSIFRLLRNRKEVAGEIVLLEASPSFFAFEHVLKALQQHGPDLPFAEYFAMTSSTGNAGTRVPPPLYMEGCTYNLSMLEKSRQSSELRKVKADQFAAARFQDPVLDAAQLQAVLAALTQKLVLIQGPPGCGKTYVGVKLVQLLLANTYPGCMLQKPQAADNADAGLNDSDSDDDDDDLRNNTSTKPRIGPILCITYTNHALDQFLVGLLDAGVPADSVVRIGGRSKSDRLAQCNLFTRRMNLAHKTRSGGFQRYTCHKNMEQLEKDISPLLESLQRDRLEWEQVDVLLETLAPQLHESFEPTYDPDASVSQRPWHTLPVDKQWRRWCAGRDLQEDTTTNNNSTRAAGATMEASNAFSVLHIDSDDEDDWDEQPVLRTHATKRQRRTAARVHRGPPRTLDEILTVVDDAWQLNRAERNILLAALQRDVLEVERQECLQKMQEHQAELQQLTRLQQQDDMHLLRDAAVVGVTTSGGAKVQDLINAMGAHVVIVEEAAEVLEAHILASLSRQTQHLILIGDHRQLRPKTEVYELSVDSGRGYNLDLSLFERMVNQAGFATYTLSTQRRMRPQIADLIRQTIYPHLKDDSSVAAYPRVRGVAHDVFFFDHDNPESGEGDQNVDSKSKVNVFEARMVCELAKYLLKQGYDAGSITIITPYVGQLLELRKLVSREVVVYVSERDEEQIQRLGQESLSDDEGAHNEGEQPSPKSSASLTMEERAQVGAVDVTLTRTSLKEQLRLATIDNFQGEESKIIIISLVRNNRNGRIGFLKSANRINVLLSRAMHGMYIFGNTTTLTQHKQSFMWPRVLDMLKSKDCYGQRLQLMCSKHPDQLSEIAKPEDFERLVGDGGCGRQCSERLPCGHQCPRRCHPDDPHHRAVVCPKPCSRLRSCEDCPHLHLCPKLCGEPCGKCKVVIPTVELPCGHVATHVLCHEARTPVKIQCKRRVMVSMPGCGHEQTALCKDTDSVSRGLCCTEVDVVMPNCRHTIKAPCHAKTHITTLPEECSAPCGLQLACGHPCINKCGRCLAHAAPSTAAVQASTSQHQGTCNKMCGRPLFCGHTCSGSCHAPNPCSPCSKKCQVKCVHTKCSQRCHVPCAPCAEPCAWSCPHQGACTLPCGAPCDRLPCNERCYNILRCGHRCPSVCGEPCPPKRFCPGCASPSSNIVVKDLLMLEDHNLAGYDADNEPFIVLACGHVFCMSTLDGIMCVTEVYSYSADGAFKAPLPVSGELADMKTCSMCRTPITGVQRYGRIVNKALLDHAQRKALVEMNKQLHKCKLKLRDLQKKLDAGSVLAPNTINTVGKRLRDVFRQCATPPTIAVYNATWVAIDRMRLAGLLLEHHIQPRLQMLSVPHPDVRALCEALLCLGNLEGIRLENNLSQAESNNNNNSGGSSQRGPAAAPKTVDNILANASDIYSRGKGYLNQAVQVSDAAKHWTMFATAKVDLAVHEFRYAKGLQGVRFIKSVPLAHKQSIRDDQLRMLSHAAALCEEAEVFLRVKGLSTTTAATDIVQRAKLLAEQAEQYKAKVLRDTFYQEVTPEEKKSIFAVMIRDFGDNQGWGQGHWFTCPNGHVYTIGDCVGARQESTCPECGERVGGRKHALATGNRMATEFLQEARGGA